MKVDLPKASIHSFIYKSCTPYHTLLFDMHGVLLAMRHINKKGSSLHAVIECSLRVRVPSIQQGGRHESRFVIIYQPYAVPTSLVLLHPKVDHSRVMMQWQARNLDVELGVGDGGQCRVGWDRINMSGPGVQGWMAPVTR